MIVRTVLSALSLSLFLSLSSCKPRPAKLPMEWPYADTNNFITYKRIIKKTPSSKTRYGLLILSSNRVNYAVARGHHILNRNQVWVNTNTMIWLPEQGNYTFPARGELMQGASMKLGDMDNSPVVFHIEQSDGEFFRTMDMEKIENTISHEVVDTKALAELDDDGIEKLIRDLQSSNLDPAPFGWGTGIPVNYDLEAQKRVWRAENKLAHMGFKAFPALIHHIDDTAYCKSYEWSELVSYTVGQVCGSIITKQINIAGEPHRYKDRKGRKGMWDAPYFWTDNSTIESWWQNNKHRSLEELQLESVDYVIAKEKALGFVSPEQEKEVLSRLENIRQCLLKKIADKAYR